MNSEKGRNLQLLIRQLREKKDELISHIEKIENNGLRASVLNTTGELSGYDNHPADLASETFERAKDIGLKDNERVLLQSVETALDKAAAGTYGTCDNCGEEIEYERLEALPWAQTCINCSRKAENESSRLRPLEEETLEPIFKGTFQGRKNSDIRKFREEDALEMVTQYGSSDTPQDMPGTNDYKNLIP